MTRTIALAATLATTAALVIAPSAVGQSGPDVVERAVNAELRSSAVASYPDAFERAVNAELRPSSVASYPDAFQRAVDAQARSGTAARYPDAFERALNNRISMRPTTIPGDHHERTEAFAAPSTASVASTGSDIEWPQIGIGFGLGSLLALGLMFTLRSVRARELLH